MRRLGRWWLAVLVTLAAFGVTVWVSGALILPRWLASSGDRWAVAAAAGTALGAVAALWGQSFAGEADDRGEVPPPQDLACRLADAVAAVWEDEKRFRNLQFSTVIPLEWENTGRPVTAAWKNIRRQKWANKPIDLAGKLEWSIPGDPDGITEVFERVPSHRLVLLGAPGSGKSVLAGRLVISMTSHRRKDRLPAALLSLASWNLEQPFHEWAVSQLTQDYPDAIHDTVEARKQLIGLLKSGSAVLILDGLDELPADLRAEAIDQLNRQLSDTDQIVLTCRSDEYEKVEQPLSDAAVIEIQPLTPYAISEYLSGPKWEPIRTELTRDPSGSLAQALKTPLMAWLARTVFEHSSESPGLLVSQGGDASSIKAYLLDHVISATYAKTMAPGRDRYRRVSATNAERWLTFLAVNMADTRTYDLPVWCLHRWMSRISKFLVYGCSFGAAVGLSGALLYSPRFGFSFGIITGLGAGGAAAYAGPAEPPYGRDGSKDLFLAKYKSGLSFTVSLWAASGLAAAISLGLRPGILIWGAEAAAAAVAGLLAVLLSRTEIDKQNKTATTPAIVLKLSMRVTLAWALIFGSLLGLGMGLSEGTNAALVASLIGILGAVLSNAWGGLIATRGYFALGRRLPWRLMGFLEDAHKRGILRRAGAVYQFRHATIQKQLADSARGRRNTPVRFRPALIARFLAGDRQPEMQDANL